MLCTVCHKASPRIPYSASFTDAWAIRAAFIAEHRAHNRQWAQGWTRAFRRAVMNGGPSATAAEREQLEALWATWVRKLEA